MSVTRLPPRNPGNAGAKPDPLTAAFNAGEVVMLRMPRLGVRIIVPTDAVQVFFGGNTETYEE